MKEGGAKEAHVPAPVRAAEPELTTEQLQRAYRHLARPGWPESLDAVLRDPLRGPCVRGLARQFTREPLPARRTYRPPTPPHATPLPATPTEPPRKAPPARHARAQLPLAFDAKRAAANDLDD